MIEPGPDDYPLEEEESEIDYLVVKSITVSECFRFEDSRRFLLISEDGLEPWDAQSLLWGGQLIVEENFRRGTRNSGSEEES